MCVSFILLTMKIQLVRLNADKYNKNVVKF